MIKNVKRAAVVGGSLVVTGGLIYLASDVWHGWPAAAACVGSLVAFTPTTARLKRSAKGMIQTERVSGAPVSPNKILLIRIEGVIMAEKVDTPLAAFSPVTQVSGYQVQEWLKDAAEDPTVKAVIVQFSTPGGTLAGSRAILDGMTYFKEKTNKPVVAHVDTLCASGGVYAMVGADKVYAEPGSLIGSIGVTLGTHHWYDRPTSVGGLLDHVETSGGVQSYTLAAGKGKDLLNPWREPAEEERNVLQAQLDELYDSFVQHVCARRGISEHTIRDRMGAYVFANNNAQSLGLIDGTMTRSGVFREAAYLAGIVSSPFTVVKPVQKKPSLLRLALGGPSAEARQPVSSPPLLGPLAIAPWAMPR